MVTKVTHSSKNSAVPVNNSIFQFNDWFMKIGTSHLIILNVITLLIKWPMSALAELKSWPIAGWWSHFIPPENSRKVKVFRGHNMGILTRNGLNRLKLTEDFQIKALFENYLVIYFKFLSRNMIQNLLVNRQLRKQTSFKKVFNAMISSIFLHSGSICSALNVQ